LPSFLAVSAAIVWEIVLAADFNLLHLFVSMRLLVRTPDVRTVVRRQFLEFGTITQF